MISDRDKSDQKGSIIANIRNKSVIESLVSGTLSSTITTVVYQPLDLLKTRIQLQERPSTKIHIKSIYLGRVIKSAVNLVKNDGPLVLWKGTGASILRSGPGVGLYYSLLNILQTNYSSSKHRPDDATQAFYFGMVARSVVSSMLLPITVVKVRYESGRFRYHSLIGAVSTAYRSSNGWVGLVPTVLRDSIFSGTYYMCYTQLKSKCDIMPERDKLRHHMKLFSYGILSGLLASLITNPIDVLKTAVQAESHDLAGGKPKISTREVVCRMFKGSRGFLRFLDGLVPRVMRRTLISASTWTFYELMSDFIHVQ